MDYIEGQSIGVLVPGPHDFGEAYHFRLYSIASPRNGEDGKAGNVFDLRAALFLYRRHQRRTLSRTCV